MRDERHQPAIVTAGLEQIAATRRPTILDVDRSRHAARDIRIGDESLGTQKSVFFAVGDDEEDPVPKMLVTNRARDFNERRDAHAVVACARTCADGIVVRAEHENVGARIAGQPGDDIRDGCAGPVGVARKSLLQRGLISKLTQLRRHTIANHVVSRRSNRMRRPIAENRRQHAHGTGGRKAIGRGTRREWLRTAALNDDGRENHGQDQRDNGRGPIRRHRGILCNLSDIPTYARVMHRHLLCLSTILLTAATSGAATLRGNFDRTFDVKPGVLFALDNTNGHIAIRSWDQPRIQVHAVKKVESRDSDIARRAFDNLIIEPSVTADAVRINTRYPRQSQGLFDWIAGTNVNMGVEYEVTVPRTTNLEIDDTNGAIDVTDVRGSHRLSTTNGHIELLRCSGDVDAETTNGHIRAELAELTPGRSLRLETTNGGITVALPRAVAARVDASTTNGSIKTELPVTTTEFKRSSLRGTLNGGGSAELRLRTTNGSINIEAR